MSSLVQFPDLALSREQAAEWVARIDRGLSATERTELRRWCAAPGNARALQEMTALWGNLDSLRALADVFPPGEDLSPAASAPRRRGRGLAAAAAVACLAVLAGIASYMLPRTGSPDAVVATVPRIAHVTTVGEQRDETLGDGSVLSLNTDSLVEVALGEATRELRLVRGEVHFAVAHDAQRPFRVHVGGRVVQAVGTAFDVRLRDNGVEVIVTEGLVRVLDDTREAPLLAGELAPGESLWIDADGSMRRTLLDEHAMSVRMAWRGGMLVFDGERLEDALDEFSRYTHARFEITEPRLRALRVGGYFPAGDTDALLATLGSEFGLTATRGADDVIRIGPGPQTSAR